MAYEKAYQRDGQTTDDFAAEFQVLEKQLGYSHEGPANDKMRANMLFAKLRLELRMEISRRGDPPATRRGLVDLARSIEIAERLFGSGRAREHAGSGRAGPGRARGVKAESPGRATSMLSGCRHCGGTHPSSRCAEAVCYKCQEKGHYASACPT